MEKRGGVKSVGEGGLEGWGLATGNEIWDGNGGRKGMKMEGRIRNQKYKKLKQLSSTHRCK